MACVPSDRFAFLRPLMPAQRLTFLPPNGQPAPPPRTERTVLPSPKPEDLEDQEDAAVAPPAAAGS